MPGPTAEAGLAALRVLRQHGGRWAVVMLRGGHFAAGVFHIDPARVANPRQPDKFEALAHKSAHRYVVRCVPGWAGRGCRAGLFNALARYGACRGQPRVGGLTLGASLASAGSTRCPSAGRRL